MSSKAIAPPFVARLANEVYALTSQPSLDHAFRILNTSYRDAFEFGAANLLKGKTGGFSVIKCRTAFGFVLVGKVALRATPSSFSAAPTTSPIG
jgi:triacylglycerol lipase